MTLFFDCASIVVLLNYLQMKYYIVEKFYEPFFLLKKGKWSVKVMTSNYLSVVDYKEFYTKFFRDLFIKCLEFNGISKKK